MAMKVRYTTLDGEIVSENRSGAMRDYVPDPLGSTVALLDNSQTQTDTFTYWPYGENQTRTGSTATALQYAGTAGYYRDSASKTYVRARPLDTAKGRWTAQDPIGFRGGDANLYRYVFNSSAYFVDPSGLSCIDNLPIDRPINEWDLLPCWCIHVGVDCVGNDCVGNPSCPKVPDDRDGHFTCNTGFNYGACGPFAYATTPSNPHDCISEACAVHDDCLKDWIQFIIPGRRKECDGNLCKAALMCTVNGACDSSPNPALRNPALCRQVAWEVAIWMCLPCWGTIPILGCFTPW